jgi:hypothetical protein
MGGFAGVNSFFLDTFSIERSLPLVRQKKYQSLNE